MICHRPNCSCRTAKPNPYAVKLDPNGQISGLAAAPGVRADDRRLNTPDEAIEVLQALKAGKQLQMRHYNSSDWCDTVILDGFMGLNFTNFQYRVKPVPLVRFCIVRKRDDRVVGMYDDRTAAEASMARRALTYGSAYRVVEMREVQA